MKIKTFIASCCLAMTISFGCPMSGYAQELPQTLPLPNAGFEQGLKKWAVLPEFRGEVSVTTLVHSGKKAVLLDATTKNNRPYIVASAKDLIGNSVYRFSVWAQIAPGSAPVSAAVKMESYSSKKNNGGWYEFVKLPADGAWHRISLEKKVPADTIRCQLLLRVFGKGAVVFDDATIELTKQAPNISVMNPVQMPLQPHQKCSVSYQLVLREAWRGVQLPKITALVKPLTGTGKSYSLPVTVSRADDDRHLHVSFMVPGLEAMDYQVDFSYSKEGKKFVTASPAYIFTTIDNRKPEFLTENGTILWHGEPFFPIGMYHPRGELGYKVLAKNGFNAVQGTATLDLDRFKKSLDLAHKYGLAVDVPLYRQRQAGKNLANSLEKVKRFSDHPAVLCWKLFDEPSMVNDGDVAAMLPSVYRALKAANPRQPLELTLNTASTQKFWKNYCDILQTDCYPLPRYSVEKVHEFAAHALDVKLPWQNVSFVLQSGWNPDLSNQPTVAQARSMVYLALIGGAKGIWWYSMYESNGWDLTKTPLWPHMKEINAEIKALSKPLMLGKVLDTISCDQSKIYFRAVEYQQKVYLLVTNPQEAPLTATFTLPPNLRSLQYRDNSKSVLLDKKQLTLSLQSLESRTLILE